MEIYRSRIFEINVKHGEKHRRILVSIEEMRRKAKTHGWMDKCLVGDINAISTLIFNEGGTVVKRRRFVPRTIIVFQGFLQVRLMDARCAFNEPYRYASR